ncbi:Mechanosensitive ion channel [Dyella sp. OK004]|uniref:mechanosensitive ion channel family protein n=1 Tax=Dyella sp. OK004 TaxID=1855292 RepID=UPI0008E0893D|nr:mechanosensitive ion channel domain-containing protein [Dyella sp. OK004]SFR92057.1 Mechanosensitive ion channel [Dyella sp. OK004]
MRAHQTTSALTTWASAGVSDAPGNWFGTRLIHTEEFDLSLGAVIAACLLFLACLVLSAVLRYLLRRYARRHDNVNQSAVYTVGRLTHYLLLTLGVLLALNATGIPMARFTVFAGALGVGLGFGLQAIFNNFVCGLILLFDRSLKVGDFVELASGVHGVVRDIHIRATRVTTNDDLDILVPNSEFVNGQVVNWTVREGLRRLKVPFHVAYGSDKEQVKEAALDAARAVPHTHTLEGPRAPQVWLAEFGDWALKFQLVVWLNADATRRPGAAKAAYNWALHSALQAHGIRIPLPQYDVRMRDPQAVTATDRSPH